MTIPREAIEAAYDANYGEDGEAPEDRASGYLLDMQVALEAALPHLRRAWVLGVLHDQEALGQATEVLRWQFAHNDLPQIRRVAEMVLRAALEVEKAGECDHEWIDVRNEAVTSGEWCRKCNAIRAGNEER